ncbi:phage tail protein [Aquamicrobium soli]|uniref:Phage tail protein n=1 Tax=Aquamicrobium soli TaxID=1811518 RepID=A0ABV7KFS4_9HYPH
MRKLIYAAFLLGTTALYPAPAAAMPPVVGFLGGLLTAIGAPALGGAIAGIGGFSAAGFAAGYGFAGSLLGGALIKIGLSLGISYLTSLLRPRPPVPNPGARLVNMRQEVSFFDFAYGLVRKGGPVAFWKATDGKRYYDVILAAHEINRVRTRFLDEPEVTLNGTGFVQEASFKSGGRSRVQIAEYLGAAGQVAAAILMTAFPAQWTSAHDMAGLAHAVVVAENTKQEDFQKVYKTGREPVYTALIEAKKVYDPRDETQTLGVSSSYKWTTNAALIIADWITSPDGLGRSVDWDDVAAEADASDVTVTDRNGNTHPKWQLSGVYSAADDRETVRAQLGVACDCFFYEDSEGKVGFHVGRWIEPDVTIEDDDIVSVRYSEGQPGTEVANAFVVEYTEAAQGYRQAAAAAYVVDAQDEAYNESSLQVFWTPNHNQAVRVEKRLLNVARAQYTLSQVLKYQGARLLTKRFFRQHHVEAGIDMTFEVDKLSRNDDGITWTVEAHSVTGPQDFEFNAAVEEPAPPARGSFEVSKDIPEPANVAAVVETFSGGAAIKVTWDESLRDSLLYQLRFRIHNPVGDWTTVNVPPGQFFQRILGLVDGDAYDVQARTISATGQASKWVPNSGGNEDSPTLSVTIVVDPVAPIGLDTPTASGGTGQFNAIFTTKNDTHLATVAIYKVASGGTLNRTSDIVAPPYGVSLGLGYSLPIASAAGAFDIYMEPFNRSGVAGPLAGPFGVTVS